MGLKPWELLRLKKYVIFNADDFGASTGVNRGIIEAHSRGAVTSTSVMLTGRASKEAVAMSKEYPSLAIGLHWDVWGEDERSFDLADGHSVCEEFKRQLGEFQNLFGRMPTHIDSHKHAHREVMPLFLELVKPLGIPLRDDGQVRYLSGFYAQWKWKVTQLEYVSLPFLHQLLRTEVLPGFSEIGCHPGYVSSDYQSDYLVEREAELATLTDPRLRDILTEENICLISYADFNCMRNRSASVQY